MAKWLEIIELQTGLDRAQQMKKVLKKLVKDLSRNPDISKIKVYRSGSLSNDFSIHLVHRSTGLSKAGSIAGLHIASTLKEFGLMNHHLWQEMKNYHGTEFQQKVK